jgi:hypothetical protein
MSGLLEMLGSMQAAAFFAIFALSAILTLLAFVMGEIFEGIEDLFEGILGSFDIDFDIGDGAEQGRPGLFRAASTGLMALGGAGWLATVYGYGPLSSSLFAIVASLVCGGAMLAILLFVHKQQATSTIQPSTLVASTGRVSLDIPEKGVGKAVISVAGARVTRTARTEDGSALSFNSAVKVVAVEGDVIVVKPPDQTGN